MSLHPSFPRRPNVLPEQASAGVRPDAVPAITTTATTEIQAA